jgi:hypothetical protein
VTGKDGDRILPARPSQGCRQRRDAFDGTTVPVTPDTDPAPPSN